ncbi:MAG: PTS fructose transporter subunit IIB [Holophaga sp.]|jgi:PTS system galactitol-specific IIB component
MAHRQTLTILAVCGSGVVSSSMIAQKLEEILKPLGAEAKVIGLLPTSVQTYIEQGGIDFVVSTSPIPGTITVPVIKGVALLTGFGEDACKAEITRIAKEILARKQA